MSYLVVVARKTLSELYQIWQNLMGVKMWKQLFSPIYFTVSLNRECNGSPSFIFAAFMGLIQE